MNRLRITRHVAVPEHELELRFSRSGGPGGQNVNTRDTRVEIVFDVTNSPTLGPRQRARVLRKLQSRLDGEGKLHVVASDERTQARNRDLALERLRMTLADALAPDPPRRKPTKPSKAANERRLAAKKARGQLKRQRKGVLTEE